MGRSRQTKSKLQRCERRRKNQPSPETLPAGEISDMGPARFFGCYLLTSLSPRYKGHSYIGFTVNPKRRIRQHNGEITSGASKTKRKRPWEMVFCIHGFPSQVAALQFEWAWQHPKESLAVREAAASFKNLGGLANKIKLPLTMLNLPSWNSMDLTVSFFSTKYMNHTAGCPTLPRQMKLHFCSMDELPCYSRGDHPYDCDDEDDIDFNHTEDVEGESCLMTGNDTVGEDEQIVHSAPTPVHTENGTNEISSPVLIESIHRIDSFEKESYSHPSGQIVHSCQKESASHNVLEEDIDISRQIPAGVFDEDLTERSEGESSLLVIDKSSKKDDIIYEQLPVKVRGDVVWPSSIQVIDLLTPSSECRLVSGSKKRIRDSTDIIDLTRSPLFVQL